MPKLPIIDMLLKYRETNPLSFHVPGHRNGMLLEDVTQRIDEASYRPYLQALQTLMALDVTELSITDDLHDPQSSIKEAQQLAANLYGAKHTFFLVGGSTAGNIAAILATCEPHDYIIVQRNVHKSVINGCKLAGVNVVFVSPELDMQSGYSTVPKLDVLKEAIQQYPNAKAVFLTNPNYYGVSLHLEAYANLIHNYNMLLIVDEAHGAHYGFHTKLPKSVLSYGADIVIQSTHKTLPSVTMSAMLHVNSDYIDLASLQEQLAMVESSSPSFLMLATLDIARAIMEKEGATLIEQSLRVRQRLAKFLQQQSNTIKIADYDTTNEQAVCYDPLRIHMYDETEYYSGYELQQCFEQHGIWAEMATSKHCILVLHIGYTEKEYFDLQTRLEAILEHINDKLKSRDYELASKLQNCISSYYNSPLISEPILMTRGVKNKVEIVEFEHAIGEISAEMIVPYPPGIPILYGGEKITIEKIQEIQHYVSHQAKFQANDTIYEGKIKIIVNNPYN